MVSDANPPTGERGEFAGYGADREAPPAEAAPAEAWRDAFARFGETRAYVAHYIQARIDGLKLSLRKMLMLAAVGVIGAIAGGALVVTAVVLLCVGIAQGLSTLFGGRPWLGNLVTAVLLLGVVAGVVWIGLSRMTKSSKERVVDAYERRKRREREDYGIDAHERAEQQQQS
jgi:hypothetical protein